MSRGTRYKVVDAASVNPGIVAAVIDTQDTCPAFPEHGRTVCECFRKSAAERVAAALEAVGDRK